jgi:hypothetical protein
MSLLGAPKKCVKVSVGIRTLAFAKWRLRWERSPSNAPWQHRSKILLAPNAQNRVFGPFTRARARIDVYGLSRHTVRAFNLDDDVALGWH